MDDLRRTLTTHVPCGIPKPTCVIDAGYELWALWQLDACIVTRPHSPRGKYVIGLNRILAGVFGGDVDVTGINPLIPLPGTVRRPSPAELEMGRVATLVDVIEDQPNRVYGVELFEELGS